MANYNIGPKIGIEGEKEFRAQISRINQEYKTLDAQTRAVTAAMEAQGNQQGKLEAQSRGLEKQIALQKQKMAELESAISKATEKFGANSVEVNRLQGVLFDTEATVEGLAKQLRLTNEELDDFKRAIADSDSESAKAKAQLDEYRQQLHRVGNEYDVIVSESKAVVSSFSSTADAQSKLQVSSAMLERQLEVQRRKMDILSESVSLAATAYGENSDEATRFRVELNNTSAAVSKLEKELTDTDDELRRMAEGLEDVGEEAAQADDKVLSFGDVLKAGIASGAILNAAERVADVIIDVGQASIEAAAEVKAANAQFEQTFGDLEGTARNALGAVSDETGIAVTRLQSGYTALYAFTKSVGGDSATALNIAQRALAAAADSAAYYDRTMEDATETLQSFLKGNYENDAALGIAATETTRNAKANELYAKSFNELTEAQKVDTLLAMVEAGNAASGALGQAAREADSWANVTGELGEAWRQLMATLGSPVLEGLTPIIQGITGAINEMVTPKSWESLRTAVSGMTESFQKAETSLGSTLTQVDANASLAQRYVDRLRELEGAGLDNADAQREYAQTVELLNGIMPELGLTINTVTGRLDQNTWAIEDNIDALKEQARQQSQQAHYKTLLDSYGKAYEALYAAETRRNELLARQKELLEQGAVVHETYSYAQMGSTAALDEFTVTMSEADKELAQVNHELTALDGEYNTATQTLVDAEAQLDAAAEATDGLASSTGGAVKATDALTQAVDEAQTAYLDMKAAARESIDSQIGLFTELDTKSDQSAEKIVENWGKQREAFASYSDNLRKAVEMGLDEALVQQLSDGSQQSMQILHEFVNGTEMSIDEINAAFRGLDEAKDEVSDAMAYIESMADGTYDKMVKAAKEAGYDTVEGLVAGIRNNSGILENAMRDMGKKAQVAFNRVMQIQSPSKTMERSGGYVVAGAVQGVERNIRDLEAAMADMARAGNAAYLQEQLDYVAQYPSMVAGAPGYGGSSTTNNSHVAYGGINITINTQPGQDAHSIADVVLEELTVRLGQEEARF